MLEGKLLGNYALSSDSFYTVSQNFEVPWNIIPSVILHAFECTKHYNSKQNELMNLRSLLDLI